MEVWLNCTVLPETLLKTWYKFRTQDGFTGTVDKLYSELEHSRAQDLIHAFRIDFGFRCMEASVELPSNQRIVMTTLVVASAPISLQ